MSADEEELYDDQLDHSEESADEDMRISLSDDGEDILAETGESRGSLSGLTGLLQMPTWRHMQAKQPASSGSSPRRARPSRLVLSHTCPVNEAIQLMVNRRLSEADVVYQFSASHAGESSGDNESPDINFRPWRVRLADLVRLFNLSPSAEIKFAFPGAGFLRDLETVEQEDP
jgi:hypothetical protein